MYRDCFQKLNVVDVGEKVVKETGNGKDGSNPGRTIGISHNHNHTTSDGHDGGKEMTQSLDNTY
jgi:hypothetical protein